MISKTLTISFQIPVQYQYLARNPYGSFMLFKELPVISEDDGGEGGEPNWALQKGELQILDDDALMPLNESPNWRDSVRKI